MKSIDFCTVVYFGFIIHYGCLKLKTQWKSKKNIIKWILEIFHLYNR
jgi:hypothetical protein